MVRYSRATEGCEHAAPDFELLVPGEGPPEISIICRVCKIAVVYDKNDNPSVGAANAQRAEQTPRS